MNDWHEDSLLRRWKWKGIGLGKYFQPSHCIFFIWEKKSCALNVHSQLFVLLLLEYIIIRKINFILKNKITLRKNVHICFFKDCFHCLAQTILVRWFSRECKKRRILSTWNLSALHYEKYYVDRYLGIIVPNYVNGHQWIKSLNSKVNNFLSFRTPQSFK